MPLQATSGAASYDAFGGGVAAVPNYIEDVFSTYLYTGNGSTQTINNGIDLAGKGGLTWIKRRSFTNPHALYDTNRGATSELSSNTTGAAFTNSNGLTAFNASGFSIGPSATVNLSDEPYVSWTFREQPKFFDVVTWTATSTTNTNLRVSHNLGSVPGCIFIKATSTTDSWYVYHRELGINQYVRLNATSAAATNTPSWGTSNPTSTDFGFNENLFVASAPTTFVAYVFAHNAGGFGLTGTDNVISCGSYTGVGSTQQEITLGYEPQWVMIKRTDTADSWIMVDNMRGFFRTADNALEANSNNAEATGVSVSGAMQPTATGFRLFNANSAVNATGGTYIYIAIRRGPMKVPTSGTSVFAPSIRTGTGTTTTVSSTSFPPDLYINGDRTYGGSNGVFDRLRGRGILQSLNTAAENATSPSTYDFVSWGMNGEVLGAPYNINMTGSGRDFVDWNFGRAPSFMDVVCYTGTGSTTAYNHNLGVAPELMIIKSRNDANDWAVYSSALGNTKNLRLNTTAAASSALNLWASTTPSATTFTTNGTYNFVGGSGITYVAYLFASAPGVSKVGSVTHVEPTTVVCGFIPRFVLLKSTASTGTDDWYVFDSARGITSGNDPYLRLNSTGAENTPFGAADFIDPTADGFIMNGFGGGNYIFLAIA